MDRPHTLLQRLGAGLLGRTGERVRSTDWWMVFVEIAIVVLGILIAFQLDRWGDRRQARRDEQQLMAQIAEEARQGSRELNRFGDQHGVSAAHLRQLAAAVERPALSTPYPTLGDGCDILRLPAVRRQSGGAIAQGAGPRIELLRDSKLRALLRRAESDRQFAERQLDFFRATFLNYGERIEPHMLWTFEDGAEDGVRCTVDIAGLRADSDAVALLPKVARDQLKFAEYRYQERDDLNEIVKRVSCLQSGRCSPDL